MTSFDDIVVLYNERLESQGTLINYMQAARDHVNGDVVIPLPEMDADEAPAVANLIAHGLDQTAMRVASVMPNLVFPPLQPGKDKGVQSEDWARTRQLAVASWWEQSNIKRKMRRAARWLIGYGRTPLVIRPNFATGIPEYVLRDPLGTFPAATEDWDDNAPPNVIFAFTRSISWLDTYFPDVAASYRRRHGGQLSSDTVFELLEYIDADEWVIGVKGIKASSHLRFRDMPNEPGGGQELLRVPNRAGVCLAVTANRITFDRLIGQFNSLFGVYQNQAALMALELIAVKKGIFPDIAITSTVPGRTPTLVNGHWADGRTGEVNIVKDGRVDVLQLNPGFLTQPTIDRLERYQRIEGGVPAQWGGETSSRIATGRLGDQVLSATVDFPIQEYQETLGDTLEKANKRAIAVAKGWFGDSERSYHVMTGKTKGPVDYIPNKHFETDVHKVTYSAPGADINSLVLGLGQRVGVGMMSTTTAMRQDPMIEDPEMEERRVVSERLQRALLSTIEQQAQAGAIAAQDVAFLWEQVEKGDNIAEAFTKAQARAQQRQAEAAEAQAAQAELGGPLPEAQAGMNPATEAGANPIPGPNPSQESLAQLLGTLRQPRQLTAPLGPASPENVPVGEA